MTVKVEAIECPGWTGLDGVHRKCRPQRSYGQQPNIIRADQEMCDRCRRQKAKFDHDNVIRARQAEQDAIRRQARLEAWLGDLAPELRTRSSTYSILVEVIEAIEQLPSRSSLPPYDIRERTSWDKPRHDDWWGVLRLLAGMGLREEP